MEQTTRTHNLSKRLLSLLLAAVMCLSVMPMLGLKNEVEAATTPATITTTQALNRINVLIEKLNGKYFTTDGYSDSSPDDYRCKNSNVIQADWFKNLVLVPDVADYMPYQWAEWGYANIGWSCFGFACYAQWFIFAQKSSDNIVGTKIFEGPLNKTNIQSYAKTGDIIRFKGHSIIFISCDDSGITFLDNNWGNTNQIQYHSAGWNDYFSGEGYCYISGAANNSRFVSEEEQNNYNRFNQTATTVDAYYKLASGKTSAVVRSSPYNGGNSNKVGTLTSGEIHVTKSGKNTENHVWYYIGGGQFAGCYIYSENVTKCSHTHDKGHFEYYWKDHPHYNCYKCSVCGEIWASKETNYIADCSTCNPVHTHNKGSFEYYWKDHPHYNCYKCSVCGEIWTSNETNYVSSCTICNPSIKWFDDGTGFYAYIIKKDSWKALENSGGNVQLAQNGNDGYDPRQIWLFNRQSDGSYEIVNMYDNTCLDAANWGTSPGTNVGTHTKNDSTAQRWFLKLTSDDNFNIFPSYCNLALDVDGNYNEPGTNIKLWTYSDNTAQQYSIYKLDWDGLTYSKPAPPPANSISVQGLGNSEKQTILEWTASPKQNTFDDRLYSIRIYKGTSVQGNAYIAADCGKNQFYEVLLPAGTYSAVVKSINTRYPDLATWGNPVTFTVPEPYAPDNPHVAFDVGEYDNDSVEVTMRFVNCMGLIAGKIVFYYDDSVVSVTKKDGKDTLKKDNSGNSIAREFVSLPGESDYGFYFSHDELWDSSIWKTNKGIDLTAHDFEAAVFRFTAPKGTVISVGGNLQLSGNRIEINDQFTIGVADNHTDHTWDNGTVIIAPTFFASGKKICTCTICGETQEVILDPLEITSTPVCAYSVTSNGHTYSLYAAKMTWDEAKAWCENNGGYLCTITSEEEQATVQSIIVNQSSSWLGAERGPDNQFRWITCEPWSYANWSAGEPNSVLENCVHIKDNYEWNDYGKTNSSPNGFIMETGDTPAAIHTWDSGKVTKEATCAATGNKTFICTVCGTTKTETISSGHTFVIYKATAPTCTGSGTIGYRECSRCGKKVEVRSDKEISDVTIPPLGHAYGEWQEINDELHQRVCANDNSHVEKATHIWDKGKVTKPASGSKPGVLTFTCTTCGATKEEKYWDQIHYQVGDLIHFGSYPQNLITDNAIISALDGITKNWINYGYYSGIQSFDVFKDVDMKYADISYNGNKYRAVSFSEYRPYYTTYAKYPDVSLQDDNGYIIGNTYYFQFEPLMWRILDPEIGLIICDKIIDAQAFQDTHYYDLKTDGVPEVYQNENSSIYANNYAMCSLRTWLNSDFFNIAFSEQEKKLIQNTSLNNDAFAAGYSQYNAPTTEDKVFLLSWNDVQTESYGFEPSRYSEDTARIAQGTDYAKCQGLEVDDQVFKISNSDHEGTSFWWLRTPSIYSFLSCTVDGDGVLHGGDCDLLFTGGGVRPACRIINTKPETKCKDGHTWDAGIITESATCAASGEKTFTCTVCGTTKTETIVKTTSHKWDSGKVTKAATCAATGTKTFSCSVCKTTKTETIAKTTDHKWDAGKVTQTATCAATGAKTFTCSVCKTTKTEIIAKTTSHKWDAGKVTKAATCAATGVKTFTCTICKTTKTEIIAKTTDHKWDSGKVTKAATCAATGVKTFTCSVCKATKTETLAKTKDHKWDAGVVTVAPTCKRHGILTYTCTVCNTTKTMDMTNTPHQYTSTGKCANCGAAMAGYIAPSLPDDVGGDGKVISGDVDGDGEVTSGDARLALRTSVRLENIVKGTDAYQAADADNDGEVTSGDARLILRSSVGLEDLRKFRENK